MANNKQITIGDLAGMVKRGFDGVDKRFDTVDKRFDEAKKERQEIKSKLASLERRIIFLEDTITKHTKELEKIKKMIKVLQGQKRVERRKVISLEQRVEALEKFA